MSPPVRGAGPRIALVAGEVSGDILGGGLMSALKRRYPGATFYGVGGKRMQGQGLEPLFPMARLSVMGLAEVLRHLPELLRIRRALYERFAADRPALFIGIDSPDFNIGLEARLRARGLRTVHYVSPSVWAWRQGRVRKVARAADLVLALFPFEADFYRRHAVPVRWVGHPLADEIPLACDPAAARAALALEAGDTVLALLPGSRMGEVARLAPVFLEAARRLSQGRPRLICVVPAATPRLREYLQGLLDAAPRAPRVILLDGRSREAMAGADAVLLASGTATLEAALLKRPMVVAYRVARLTAWILARMVKVRRFALPNLLAGRDLVPELLQERVTPENLAAALAPYLDDPAARSAAQDELARIHRMLRRDASERAAEAVSGLLA